MRMPRLVLCFIVLASCGCEVSEGLSFYLDDDATAAAMQAAGVGNGDVDSILTSDAMAYTERCGRDSNQCVNDNLAFCYDNSFAVGGELSQRPVEFWQQFCTPPRPPPPPPAPPEGYLPPTPGPTYQYTSFEEPADMVCPAACDLEQGGGGCGQNDCASMGLASIADSCTEGVCAVPNLAGIDGDDSGAAGFTTSYTAGSNGDAELGFAAFWEPCAAENTTLTAVGLPACDFNQDDGDMFGVISNTADGNTAWGAAGDNQHLGDRGMFPHGAQVFMLYDPDG
eukprot:SAG11_NODE_8697_length_986_cov_1.341601_1_plen_281_part_01